MQDSVVTNTKSSNLILRIIGDEELVKPVHVQNLV
jgi:hypothetical protein